MKNSGIEWIGEIPDSWKLVRFKDICVNKKEIAGESSENYERLALTLGGVIKRPKYDSDGLQPKEFDGYQIICENDFIFKMIDLQNISTSRVGLSPYRGLVSPAYIRFSPREEGQYNEYVYYFLMSMYYNCVYNSLGGNGVRSALNATDIGQLMIPFPAIEKQQRIVAFLENAFKKIDKLIEVQQAQIEKLKEYKQSVITEAVTKGLDPTAPMKDSGVEWIGKIPEGWNVKGIKKVASFVNGYAFASTEFRNEGVMVLKITNVQPQEMVYDNLSYVDEKYYDKLTAFRLNKGDLLFALTRPIINGGIKVGIYLKDDICLINQRTAKLQPKSNLNSKWIMYLCCVKAFLWEYSLLIDVTGLQPNISANDILTIKIPLPKIEMQKEIIAYLDDKCAKIDKLIALKQSKIDKLQEYKKSLIYEYVTGKKEVM